MILLIRQSGTEDRIGHLEKQAMDHNRFKFQVLSSPLKFIRANLHHNNVNKNNNNYFKKDNAVHQNLRSPLFSKWV